jgi:hypothetical protein
MMKIMNHIDDEPVDIEEWAARLVSSVKATMRAEDVDFGELARRLSTQGVELDRVTLSNRVNRAGFSAAFFCQILVAFGIDRFDLETVRRGEPLDTHRSSGRGTTL